MTPSDDLGAAVLGRTILPRQGVVRLGWTRVLAAARRPEPAVLVIGVLIALFYGLAYAADPAAPGNNPRFSMGWWGWWDQSHYLASARALSQGRLEAGQHWYPLG